MLKFNSPLEGDLEVTSRCGMRKHPVTGEHKMHWGTDYRAAMGAPVYSIADGTVISVGKSEIGGNTVTVQHRDAEGNKITSRYLHLSGFNVKEGDVIKGGQQLGKAGATGRVTGAHLHIEVKDANGEIIDPDQFLKTNGALKVPAGNRSQFQEVLSTRKQLEGAELQNFLGRAARNYNDDGSLMISSGRNVEAHAFVRSIIKSWLQSEGRDPSKADTGDFKTLVCAFQRAHPPLRVDGVVGPRTLYKMMEFAGGTTELAQYKEYCVRPEFAATDDDLLAWLSQGDSGSASFNPSSSVKLGETYKAHVTGYYPSDDSIEGGYFDRFKHPLKTIEDFLSGRSDYVSVAMDTGLGIDNAYIRIPEMDRKFADKLQGRRFKFKVVDTGGAFIGAGTGKVDICCKNEDQTFSITGPMSWSIDEETTDARLVSKMKERSFVESVRFQVGKGEAKAPTQLQTSIAEAAKKYNIDPVLLDSLIWAESNYDPKCVSSAGAQGLCQLMPETAASLGVTDVFDVKQNIDGGARYLRQQLDRFKGNIALALAAYNAGPGAVNKYGAVPPYQETKKYVAKILDRVEKLEGKAIA